MSSDSAVVRRLAHLPFWIVAALVALHAAALTMEHGLGVIDRQPWRFLHHQLHLDRELNVATWAATLLLVAASALLGVIGLEKRQSGDRRHGYWVTLAIVFLLLSLDEMCSFHERLSEPVGERLPGGGILTNAWVVVVSAALPAVVLDSPPPSATVVVVAGAAVSAAVSSSSSRSPQAPATSTTPRASVAARVQRRIKWCPPCRPVVMRPRRAHQRS